MVEGGAVPSRSVKIIPAVSQRVHLQRAHQLLAPTLLRSQALSQLRGAVQRGEVPADVGRDFLARIGRIKITYLGDAVLRRRAWDLAEQIGPASTYDAEYIALTQLQGDALVTLDTERARLAEEFVRVASIEDLQYVGQGSAKTRGRTPPATPPAVRDLSALAETARTVGAS